VVRPCLYRHPGAVCQRLVLGVCYEGSSLVVTGRLRQGPPFAAACGDGMTSHLAVPAMSIQQSCTGCRWYYVAMRFLERPSTKAAGLCAVVVLLIV
jgi:hypothetical protein